VKPPTDILIYEGGDARVEVRIERENVWLSLQQLAELFGRDKSVVSRHLKNIFATRELEREAVVAKMQRLLRMARPTSSSTTTSTPSSRWATA